MSLTKRFFVETSILTGSQMNNDNSQRSSKRFRPSVQCNHFDKQTSQQCMADGFMECVHCDKICCLNHITQHQNELKELRDNLVEKASETYVKLSEMQVTDTRAKLHSDLAIWKKKMVDRIERMHNKLIDNIEDSYEKVNSDFELKKHNLVKEFDENVSTKLERLSTKSDFYPHELDELKVSIEDMFIRIQNAQTSFVNIDFGSDYICMADDNNSFDVTRTIESPTIVIQKKPDVRHVLTNCYTKQFHIEIDNCSERLSLCYDSSNKYFLFCNNSNNTLELFDHEQRIAGVFWPKDAPFITCIKWCSYLNRFLILCSRSLYALNCSEEKFSISPIQEIKPIDENCMDYLSIKNDLILIKNSNGASMNSYSLKTMELIKCWLKRDFYNDEDNNKIAINRIEFCSTNYLAFNVNINDEKNTLDLFIYPNIQHIRRLEKSHLLLYLPLNNYWIIKQDARSNQTDLCLLDQYGQTFQLDTDQNENIDGMCLFGKHSLLTIRRNCNLIQIQMFYVEKF